MFTISHWNAEGFMDEEYLSYDSGELLKRDPAAVTDRTSLRGSNRGE
jgi:hypothetical protein